MTRRPETPDQRRHRVKRERRNMTLNALDRSALEHALFAFYAAGGKRNSIDAMGVMLKHVYGNGPKAQTRGGIMALASPRNPFWDSLGALEV